MKTAMILAAGRGERLRPLTDTCPKSLCLIGNKPLIVHHVESLKLANISQIVINHAWLGGKIRQFLGNGQSFGVTIEYSAEPPGGLETGGGIVSALPLLGDSEFICINADIFTDFDYQRLPSALLPSLSAHLVLTQNPPHNSSGDFGLSQGMVSNDNKMYTYTGIAIYHPKMFKALRLTRFSLASCLKDNVENHCISGQVYSGQWLDIGSRERLTHANLIAQKAETLYTKTL